MQRMWGKCGMLWPMAWNIAGELGRPIREGRIVQSTLAPEALTSAAQIGTSAAMKSANSAAGPIFI
jgi:hypothetical protein